MNTDAPIAHLRAALAHVADHLDRTDPSSAQWQALDALHRTLTDALLEEADAADARLAPRLAEAAESLATVWNAHDGTIARWPDAAIDTARALGAVLRTLDIDNPLDFLIQRE